MLRVSTVLKKAGPALVVVVSGLRIHIGGADGFAARTRTTADSPLAPLSSITLAVSGDTPAGGVSHLEENGGLVETATRLVPERYSTRWMGPPSVPVLTDSRTPSSVRWTFVGSGSTRVTVGRERPRPLSRVLPFTMGQAPPWIRRSVCIAYNSPDPDKAKTRPDGVIVRPPESRSSTETRPESTPFVP